VRRGDPGAHRDVGRRIVALLAGLLVPGTGHFVFAGWGAGLGWFAANLVAVLSLPVGGVATLALFLGLRLLTAALGAFMSRSKILYPPWRTVLLGWAGLFGFTLLFAAVARDIYLADVAVPGAAMLPTVAPGDRLVVSRAVYALRVPFSGIVIAHPAAPMPGDVVFLRLRDRAIVRRVVAVAGDRVALQGGLLQVNGLTAQQTDQRPLPLPGPPGPAVPVAREDLGGESHDLVVHPEDLAETVVPPGTIYVLADDRRVHDDSRAFGPVRLEDVQGKVAMVWWSADRAGPRWERIGSSMR